MASKISKALWSCSCMARTFLTPARNASSSSGTGFGTKQVTLTTPWILQHQNNSNSKILKDESGKSKVPQQTFFPLKSLVFNPALGTRLPMGLPINYNIRPIIGDIKPKNKPMEDPLSKIVIIEEAPEISENRIEKQAARLVVIRRIKMNRHKLKKLRKRQKQEIAKKFLRRNIRKERAFLDARLAQIREAERFDAAQHVATLIAKAKEKPLPRYYKGKRMPAWWIKEQIALGNIKF